MVKSGDWSQGCRHKANATLIWNDYANNKSNQGFIFKKIAHTDFYGYDLNFSKPVTLMQCKRMCLDNDDCQAFEYHKGIGKCFIKALLFNGRKSQDHYNDFYLKFPKIAPYSKLLASKSSHACVVTEKEVYPSSQMFKGSDSRFKFGYFLSSELTLLVIEVILITVGCWAAYKWGRKPEIRDKGYTIISSQFRRFSYKELEKATECFQEELGNGGSGAVYKGILDDKRKVAVKKLNDVIQGEQEFKSELSIIGRVYHMNLVRMWWFCAEKTYKLLVSEFVENGSLDRVLSNHLGMFPVLQWSQRCNIALGVAKGLAYLHHECLEWIVHCDVKPENILLEWALNLPITGKADVYSYGVVLLELVKGLRVSRWVVEGEKEMELAVKRTADILKDKLASEDHSWLLEFVDCRLNGEYNYSQAATVLKLAVSCVEEERRRRPSMNTVVEILLPLVE